jgi:hypothetical protein
LVAERRIRCKPDHLHRTPDLGGYGPQARPGLEAVYYFSFFFESHSPCTAKIPWSAPTTSITRDPPPPAPARGVCAGVLLRRAVYKTPSTPKSRWFFWRAHTLRSKSEEPFQKCECGSGRSGAEACSARALLM